ncbi:MAG: hypothetical protein C5B55_13600 [Blastocatellia bacterium]|nr:MAG: hypothetical protein C5B55_13600 [Blastocatellia bacterium]
MVLADWLRYEVSGPSKELVLSLSNGLKVFVVCSFATAIFWDDMPSTVASKSTGSLHIYGRMAETISWQFELRTLGRR